MTIINFNDIPLSEATTLWNKAFSDYIVPLYYSETELIHRINSLSLSETDSKILLSQNQPAGIMLYGTQDFKDNKQSWIGGIGIHPDFRRQGLALSLMNQAIKQAQQQAGDQLLLEVIIGNDRAEEIYRELGFQEVSRVIVAQLLLPSTFENQSKLSLEVVPKNEQHLQAESPIITWQNRLSTFGIVHDIFIDNHLAGFVFIAENLVEDKISSIIIKQLVLDSPLTKKISESLFATLFEKYGQIPCTISNFNVADNDTSVLLSLGFEEKLQQFQLSFPLS